MSITTRRLQRIPTKQLNDLDFNTFSGLQLWLKADAIMNQVDGDSIAVWPDSSVLAQPAINNTALEQPTFVKNAANGKPIVRFNGTSAALFSNANSASPNQTVIAVVRPNTLVGTLSIRGSTDSQLSDGGLQARIVDGVPHLANQNIEGIGYAAKSVTSNSLQVLTYTFESGVDYGFGINLQTAGSGTTAVSINAVKTSVIGRHGTTNSEFLMET